MKSPESEPNVIAKLYNPENNEWDDLWPAISMLEEECFPGKSLGEEYLREIFADKNNIVILLKKGKQVFGFTCGIPDQSVAEAVYVETTEITPNEQGRRHVVKLMNLLEDESRRRNYKFITRDAEVLNGYADKIAKNYTGRIIETKDHESEYSMGGLQRYFKIEL